MNVNIECPNCGKVNTFDLDLVKSTAQCSCEKCEHVMLIRYRVVIEVEDVEILYNPVY